MNPGKINVVPVGALAMPGQESGIRQRQLQQQQQYEYAQQQQQQQQFAQQQQYSMQQQQQQVGHPNLLHYPAAKSGTERLQRRIWAPYVNFDDWLANWRPFFRWVGLQFVCSMFICVVVSSSVNIALLDANTAIRATTIGIWQSLAFLIPFGLRQSSRLPLHCNPVTVGATLIDGDFGGWTALWAFGAIISGSYLATPLLHVLGASAVPDFSTSLRPGNLQGAVGLGIFFGTIVALVYKYTEGITLTEGADEVEGAGRARYGLSRHAVCSAIIYGLCTVITWPTGLYLHANGVMYYGAAQNLGYDIPAGSNYWAFVAFVEPIACAFLVSLICAFVWNIHGLSKEAISNIAAQEVIRRQRKSEKNTDYARANSSASTGVVPIAPQGGYLRA